MSPTNCWNLRVTAEVNQGGRRYMEDVTAVQFERAVHYERVKGDKKVVEYAAFAIFDGHGGKEAAHFARDHILENIKSQKGFFSKDVETVKKAISDGFIATHHQMWNELPGWPKTSNGHPSTAGSTASLVLIRGNKMYVANVGDSMVVMGTREYCYRNNPRGFQAMELTVDHKPELPEERKRIEHCGGCVMNKAGVNRVVWNRPKLSHHGPIRRSTKLDKIPFLAIARSLGDLWSFNSEMNEFIVSPVPDVHAYDLHHERDQFIILASDGLWNMVRPYESVTSAGTFDERKQKKLVTGTPAHELVQLALDRWKMRAMRADNTSVIVVYIERKKMESTSKKRDAYSESWTSARLEAAKNRPEDAGPLWTDTSNLPGQSDPATPRLNPTPDIVPSSSEIASLNETENSSTVASTRTDTPSNNSDEVEDKTSTEKNEDVPLQDSSISSSSGEVIDESKTFKPIIPKLVRSSRRERLDDLMTSSDATNSSDNPEKELDVPSSSIVEGDLQTPQKSEKEPTTEKRFTRRASRDLENSTKRETRSASCRSLKSAGDVSKKAQKRRKSEEDSSMAAKNRKISSSPVGKIERTNASKRSTSPSKNPASKESGATKTQKKRPASLGRGKRDRSPKKGSVSRRRSEPVLPATRRNSGRSQKKSPTKQAK